MEIDSETFSIFVKKGRPDSILGFDEEKKAYVVRISAPFEKGKANSQIIRFLSKELKKQVRIKSGFTSRTKIIEILGS